MRAHLKTLLISALLSSTAVGSIAYLSCNRDLCKTVVCANGGVCNGGSCTCVAGYEGVNCGTVSRSKFLGNWTVFEKGSYTNAAQYTVHIDTGINISDIIITNFNNYFTLPVLGSVSGDTLYLLNQDLQAKRIVGTGFITPNATYGQDDYMLVSYEVIDSVTGVADDYGYNTLLDNSAPSQWNKD